MFRFLQVNPSNSKAVEIIKAIGSTWPFLLSIAAIFFIIFYHKKIVKHLSGYNKISGKTPLGEVNLEKKEETNLKEDIKNPDTQEPEKSAEKAEPTTTTAEDASFYNIYQNLKDKKNTQAEKLFSEIQSKEVNEIEKSKNQLIYFYFQYLYGGIDTTEKIESLTTNSSNPEIKALGFEYLGDCYYEGKKFKEAKFEYEKALKFQNTQENRLSIVRSIANSLYSLKEWQSAIDYLIKIINEFKSPDHISKIYKSIASIYEKEGDWISRCLMLELAVEQQPNDTDLLFDAGYAYSDNYKNSANKFVPLSLIHYKDLTHYNSKSGGGFNNLGVAYADMGISGRSVECYSKSMSLNNTLANSNLAYKYIQQGFYEQAEKILIEAKDKDNVHENVWAALKKIADEKRSEEEKEKDVIQKAKDYQMFLREFAKVYFKQDKSILFPVNNEYKITGEIISFKQLPNPDYYELTWVDTLFKYSTSLNIKNGSAVIGEGNYVSKGGGIVNKVIVFAFIKEKQLKMFLFDKSESKGFIFNAE